MPPDIAELKADKARRDKENELMKIRFGIALGMRMERTAPGREIGKSLEVGIQFYEWLTGMSNSALTQEVFDAELERRLNQSNP